MAAVCISGRLAALLKLALRGGINSSNVTQRQSVKYLNSTFTWSHLKHLHTQARSSAAHTGFSASSRSRSGKRWLAGMATAGFCQGFLGFNFGFKKEEKKKEDPLLSVFREAKEAQAKQDFVRASVLYHDTLRVADELLKLKKISYKTHLYARTQIFDSLADMALSEGEMQKAETLYKETMKCCLQQGIAQDDNAIVELSLKLGSIYAMLDRYKEAEQGLLFCIDTQQAKLAASTEGKPLKVSAVVPDHIKEVAASAAAETTPDNSISPEMKKQDGDKKENKTEAEKKKEAAAEAAQQEELQRDTEALLGMALETYGRLLMEQRRLPEAVNMLEKATAIAAKVFGTEKSQYLVLVNDLASAHILRKDYDKAATILSHAIDTGTKIKSDHLPVLYCNLGALFLRRSKLAEAEEACLKGQHLSAQSQHPVAAVMSIKCLDKIAQVRAKEAKSNKA